MAERGAGRGACEEQFPELKVNRLRSPGAFGLTSLEKETNNTRVYEPVR